MKFNQSSPTQKIFQIEEKTQLNSTRLDSIHYLIIHRFDATVGQQTIYLLTVEVGNTDTLNDAQVNQPLHRFPCVNIVDVTVGNGKFFRMMRIFVMENRI